MKKPHYLSRILLVSALCFSVLISCSKKENAEPKYENQSMTKATFGTFNGKVENSANTEYDFKYTPIVEVDDYNENYNYELKLTGENFKKEYTVTLKAVSGVMIDNPKKDFVSVSNPISKPKLEGDIATLDMEPDTYTVVILEKESNTELSVEDSDNLPYVVYDSDATAFLSGTQLESSDRYVKLSELDLSVTPFRVRPTITNYLKGIAVVLAVYDLDLKQLGLVGYSGANSSSAGTYSFQFTSSKVNEVIPKDGEYLFRLEEAKDANASVDKVYKKALFQKIQVNKLRILGEKNKG